MGLAVSGYAVLEVWVGGVEPLVVPYLLGEGSHGTLTLVILAQMPLPPGCPPSASRHLDSHTGHTVLGLLISLPPCRP